jgi:hypothetical protein
MKRLVAQRDEAKNIGLTKVASQLSAQIGTVGTRDDAADYHYEYSELKDHVQASLWDAAIRAQDFYGKLADAANLQEIIEKQADDFINSVRIHTGASIGAYESALPGEIEAAIEVSEDD